MNAKLLSQTISTLQDTCRNRAQVCRNFAKKVGTGFEHDAILYNGKAQAYDDIANLIGTILTGK